jgi:hypothetical protein
MLQGLYPPLQLVDFVPESIDLEMFILTRSHLGAMAAAASSV